VIRLLRTGAFGTNRDLRDYPVAVALNVNDADLPGQGSAKGVDFAFPNLVLNEHGEPRLIAHDSNVTLARSGIF
jgi:hypothetical protein